MSSAISLLDCRNLLEGLRNCVMDGAGLEATLGPALTALGPVVGADRSLAFWVQKDGTVAPLVRAGLPLLETKLAARRLAEQVVGDGQTVQVADYRSRAEGREAHGPSRGLLGVPMVLTTGGERRVLGALVFEREPGRAHPEAVGFVEWAAEMLTGAMGFAAQQKQQQNQFSQLLDQVNRLGMLVDMQRHDDRDGVTDPASGLVNRAFFERHLPLLVAMAHRYGLPLSLSVVEADLPDAVAMAAGADWLAALGAEVLRQSRSCDTVARYGERTFVVALPQTDRAGADRFNARLQKAVDRLQGVGTVRLGVTTLQRGEDAMAMLVAAVQDARPLSRKFGR